MMRAGFIGYRNFAGRLAGLFRDSGRVEDILFYHPEKALEEVAHTKDLADLYGCDFIVIASPDGTHGEYLKRLADYGGHVFCEKVPVTNRDDLGFLKSNRSPRLYFDFNLRKSVLLDILTQKEERTLHVGHRMGHGLALKPEYAGGWRSSARLAPLGVFQLSGIHMFDLLTYCFGRPLSCRVSHRNVSPYGDSIDNFSAALAFEGGPAADMFFSYTSPFQYRFDVTTTEELIGYDGRELAVRGPRETFDKNGRFGEPPVTARTTVDIFGDSLEASVNYFLSVAASGGVFEESSTERDLLSTELFLEILDACGRVPRGGEHVIPDETLKQR
ncbi:MAG: Gfo/Idh/MocA family oxidoreductase [Nitrospirota bacterium]|jgi:predicted dehydrogenase